MRVRYLAFACMFGGTSVIALASDRASGNVGGSPSGECLRSIVKKEATSRTFVDAMKECAARSTVEAECNDDLGRVLGAFAAKGQEPETMVEEAFAVYRSEVGRESGAKSAGVAPRAKRWYMRVKKAPLPSASEIYRMREDVAQARVLSVLSSYSLGGEAEGAESLLRAGVAGECGQVPAGVLWEACRQVGVYNLRPVAAWLGVLRIRSAGLKGREVFRGIDRTVVRDFYTTYLGVDSPLAAYASVLGHWYESLPDPWVAWADVEGLPEGPRPPEWVLRDLQSGD